MNPHLETLLRAHPAGVPMTDEIVLALLQAQLPGVAIDPRVAHAAATVVRVVEVMHDIRCREVVEDAEIEWAWRARTP